MSSPLGQWVRWASLRPFTPSPAPCREPAGLARGFVSDETPRQTAVRWEHRAGGELKQKRCNSHLCDIYFDCLHRTEGKAEEAGISGQDQNPNPSEGPG